MAPTTPISLNDMPQEILSEIALFAATESFLGPPAGLLPLVKTNRWTYSSLSLISNPYVYAKIYESKFDVSPASRRLGVDSFATPALAQELKRKCILLNRIRDRQGSRADSSNRKEDLQQFLTQIYLMVVENEGNNERQLREFAHIDEWLKEFWLDEHGASGSWQAIQRGLWPDHSEITCLAMWLYWFLLKPEQYKREDQYTRRALSIFKVYALGAHWYPLVTPSWTEFRPSSLARGAPLAMYDSKLGLKAPALSVPAILSFISLYNLHERKDYSMPLVPSHASPPQSLLLNTIGNEWECEWGRSTNLGTQKLPADKELLDAFRPGSLDGVWEGIFTYTEFTSYAALLSGAPPHFLQNILVAQHKQTWKLREHHLLASSASDNFDSCPRQSGNVTTNLEPVAPGNALHAYFPLETQIEETPQGLTITEPVPGKQPLLYQRAGSQKKPHAAQEAKPRVLDIIITGEGHSSWGEFRLIGRVRPCDGFISLSKDYINGDRGKWLYRGYLVGNHNSNLAGRWRDTLSPPSVPGYEGCFTMTRRR
ncbi:hypothetical protein DFH05DRAFT_1485278 [Lentinula detonsa]|uniref:F-box domain-containing protein n=1 Tax=Lentinula detonsa TaxID=2804962 RepID=A0A9W8TZ98_9AGAR|nr:hypothetical protein DFH05DRAFT_1485278 [Lentinula detonsa]KAJ3980992.1 hypothetical protein F5890DRAFT_1538260 [Lentinula detonsa]